MTAAKRSRTFRCVACGVMLAVVPGKARVREVEAVGEDGTLQGRLPQHTLDGCHERRRASGGLVRRVPRPTSRGSR